ncbi:AraC family transcriptional regulator [Asanoa sp. NPDC049573]|uniref:helix-turn-helix transcriptional regulator n=1 Tax=Asanoa sp. NPDC049573 TaxID=3155396 RepID=UPI003424EB3E
MLTAVSLVRQPAFAISAVTCHDDHTGWSKAELRDRHGVVLVRSGRFRRLTRGAVTEIDPTVGYTTTPGAEEQFAHPCGGDESTWLTLTPQLWSGITTSTFYVDARLDLAHRQVLTATRAADMDYALVERLLVLLANAFGPPVGTATVDREYVAAAREAITAGHPAATGLVPLAHHLGVSPYRLSRAFPRELGVSLTRFRNRVRVGHAMQRIEAGDPHLGRLAADLGFADQAHLTRTVHAHLGHTPTALRVALKEPALSARELQSGCPRTAD